MKKLLILSAVLTLVFAGTIAFANTIILLPDASHTYTNRPAFGMLSITNEGSDDGNFILRYDSGSEEIHNIMAYSTMNVTPSAWPVTLINSGKATLAVSPN